MKWSTLLTVLLSSTSILMVSVFAGIYWRRRRSILSHLQTERDSDTSELPILDITDYKIIIIDDETQCETFFRNKLESLGKGLDFIGFDCEWLSQNFSHYQSASTTDITDHVPVAVALLQLAFIDEKVCALVRLCKIGKITKSLKLLLTDKSCLKFGVGVLNDVSRLSQEYNVSTVGCVDLRNVAVRCGIRNNISLAGLTQQLTGQGLIKHIEITCSNWEQDQLSSEQVVYAARDAIAGIMIFERLVIQKLTQRKHQRLIEDVTVHDIFSSEEGKKCAHSLCQGVIDFGFKDFKHNSSSKSTSITPGRTAAYNIRKSPLYHNCQLIAPDGTLLSTVDIKKVEWYLSKGLGELVSENPPTLRLTFEPSGKPNKDREYYLTEKENICVVCGRSDSYIRKNVVPHEYRRYFPTKMKEHMSHDVLLLCVSCHQLSSNHDGSFRLQIAAEYSAPLEASTQKFHEDPSKVKLRSLAKALSSDCVNKLPSQRREEIMVSISDHFNCLPSQVTEEMIEELATMETRQQNTSYISHGQMVVTAVQERGELIEFQQRWRQHFLDTMQPQYMPKLWSVYHNPT